jgi:CubicO group peptidase (beta-lactamase class C family)/uncharacterized protein YneR
LVRSILRAAFLRSRMNKTIVPYVSNKQFMGAVLVARDGEILFSKGYGSADLEWDIPNSAATRFRLGSLTKQFTAAAILLLEERGKLRTEDPIKKHLPEAPGAWDSVTIFHLLTHTAGIPSITDFPEYPRLEPFPLTSRQIVMLFRDRPLEFQPGERMQYSNSGYILLGHLVEKVSGESYPDFLQENIFRPLGMKDSGYDSNSEIIPRRARGYSPSSKGPVNAGFIHMSIPFSAGALYSTTEDLLRWERGLFGGRIVSVESLRKMTTPFRNGYALGVGVLTARGRTAFVHSGGIEGFSTFLARFHEDKLTVVVLGNLEGDAPSKIASRLAALAHGEKVELPSEREAITIAPKTLEQFVGTYQIALKIVMMVRLEDGQLTAQVSGEGKAPMFAGSETKYFFRAADAEIEFCRDDKGTVTSLLLREGWRETRALRISDSVVERKEIALSPEILARYAGTYELRPGFDVAITLEGGQLFSQATRQDKMQLFAESETTFFQKTIDAEVEFSTDGKGVVTSLVVHLGAVDMKAQRR